MRAAVLREINSDEELSNLEVVGTTSENTIVQPFIHDEWRSKPRRKAPTP